MLIKNFMTNVLVTVDMDDSLKTVKEIFDNSRFHHIPVLDKDKLFGIVSDRDLLKALSPTIDTINESTKDSMILNRKVHRIMTRNPIALIPENTVFDAIEIFNKEKISCIPIVDQNFRPIGMVSWRDILERLGETYGKARKLIQQ